MPKQKSAHFEKDLEKLESIVNALEEGGLSLDDSLKKFEEGIKLARTCEKALSTAEKRVEILLKNADGKLEAQPFGEEADEADEATATETTAAPKAESSAVNDDDIFLDDEEEDEDELLF